MHKIYVRDDDLHRDVYVGAQEEIPPDIIRIANMARGESGVTTQSMVSKYRRVSKTDAESVYAEVVPLVYGEE
jgi:hypothetical protein